MAKNKTRSKRQPGTNLIKSKSAAQLAVGSAGHSKELFLSIGVIIAIFIMYFFFFIPEESSSTPTPTPIINLSLKENLTGAYQATQIGVQGEINYNLVLRDSDEARLSETYANQEPLIQEGTWEILEDGAIQINFATPAASVLRFQFNQETDQLTLTDYDETVWGSAGLTLQSIGDLTSSKWLWVETSQSTGVTEKPDVAGSFSLEFTNEGKVFVGTDCNGGTGTYEVKGNELKIGPLMANMKFCEGSKENIYNSALASITNYQVTNGVLILSNTSGTTMNFQSETIVEVP